MRIAVYGGSFNPPHNGHARAAQSALRQLNPDLLLLVPDCLPPHKTLEGDSPAAEERLEMARLMAWESFPEAQVSDIEVRRGAVSYTADTLEELTALYPGARLYLLIGGDMFLSLERWHAFRRILELCTLAPFARRAGEEAELAVHALRLKERYGAQVEIVAHEPLDLSSTQVRDALRRGTGRELLAAGVYGYIIAKRFYGAVPDLGWLREQAYARLDPGRVAHVRGTEEQAVKLAGRWGVPEHPAAEAAILHDITKRLSTEEQLILCERYGIINESGEISNPKLLHAKTGAALSRELFGVSDEVFDAIRWHTTGRADMSPLEKIIYMADYIEPTRDFEGLEELRRLAYADLDEAMILALGMTLREVRDKGAVPHKDTKEALDYLLHARKESDV